MQLIKIASLAIVAFAASVLGQIENTPCQTNGQQTCNKSVP
jgi:hypothetical protein